MKRDVYSMIEEKVLDQLNNGIIPWRKYFHCADIREAFSFSHQTQRIYSPLNQMLLSLPGEYWTFEQAKKARHLVKKGSKAEQVVFWSTVSFKEKKNDIGEIIREEKRVPIMKGYNVFHETNIEGLHKEVVDTLETQSSKFIQAIDIVKQYLENNPDVSITEYDITPHLNCNSRHIYIPSKSQFDSEQQYYHTLFHEMGHSTKYALKRPLSKDDDDYAREELVAELCSAYLCGYCGIAEEDVIENAESYCARYVKMLSGNIRELVWAAPRAEQAARYIMFNEIERQDEPTQSESGEN